MNFLVYKRFSAFLATTVLGLFVFFANAIAGEMTRAGSFSGVNSHVSTGTVTIVKTDSGYSIDLGADFTFDGAPDPKIALGKDGQYDPATLMEPLRSNSGEQSYAVPASINPEDYNEVHIWCEKFSVGLAVAPVK